MNKLKLRRLLEQFFIEDIGERDMTSDTIFTGEERGVLHFIAKEDGVFCGEDVIREGFRLLDETAEIHILADEGSAFRTGDVLAKIEGGMAALLKAERVVLNLVQRMSAIAAESNKASRILAGTGTRACDTRKTTPGLRMLEKYAVRTGGAVNHRYGLYDAVMIKDNHIAFAGSISRAVERVRNEIGHTVKIEVETESAGQVIEAVAAEADIIMFDNFRPGELKRLASLVPEHIITEASGGITLETLPDYRDCGVDYISLGCLTHSVRALDISAKVLIKTREPQ